MANREDSASKVLTGQDQQSVAHGMDVVDSHDVMLVWQQGHVARFRLHTVTLKATAASSFAWYLSLPTILLRVPCIARQQEALQ